jgi:hypothetical protein
VLSLLWFAANFIRGLHDFNATGYGHSQSSNSPALQRWANVLKTPSPVGAAEIFFRPIGIAGIYQLGTQH